MKMDFENKYNKLFLRYIFNNKLIYNYYKILKKRII